ncbi:RSVR protein, partial [Heliornis fulica]|nr:RSVR protein [Heliornis fulica]
PGQFQCEPGAVCFPWEWRCDGHPDCEGEEDERGCGTMAATSEPTSDGARPTGSAEPSAGVQTRCSERFSACALSSLVLLSILVAVGSVAVWGLSKAKTRSDLFSFETASREQLV